MFVVKRINTLISRRLLIDMVIAIVLILIFISRMLTQWIYKEVFCPINELNVAMTKIEEGNIEYMLQTKSSGEIGDLGPRGSCSGAGRRDAQVYAGKCKKYSADIPV